MKQITFSAASLTIAATVLSVMLTSQARAAGPMERFASMAKAIRVTAKQEGGSHTVQAKDVRVLGLRMTDQETGSVFIVVDGSLEEEFAYRVESEPGDPQIVVTKGYNINTPTAETPKTSLSLELNAKAYKSINFGANHDSLVLTKAGKPDRYVVSLDHHSNLPKSIVIEHPAATGWQLVRKVVFSGKAAS